MKIAFILAATTLTIVSVPATAFAQTTSFSDEICFGTVLFSADKATDPDSRKLIGMLQTYYLGKLRTLTTTISMSDAVAAGLGAFEKEKDKAGAAKGCIGSIQNDLASLDALNESMSKGK